MRMRNLMAAVSLATVPALLAWRGGTVPVRTQPATRLWVSGTSTLKSFECGAKQFDAAIEATALTMVADVLAGNQSVTKVELKVPVAQLDCKNDTMNEHMLKALKSKEFAQIVFRLDSYVLDRTGDGMHAQLNGTLTLCGITKPISMNALVTPGADGALRVAGAYPFRMTDYGLKPPKLMLGTLKVHDLLTVNFDLLLKP